MTNIRPTVDQYTTDSWPIYHRQSTDTPPGYDRLSTDTVVDISTQTRPIVSRYIDQLSTDYRRTIGQLSNCRPIYRSSINWLSTDIDRLSVESAYNKLDPPWLRFF